MEQNLYLSKLILSYYITAGGNGDDRNSVTDHYNSYSRNQMASSSRNNVSSSSSRYNHHKQSQSNSQHMSDKYSHSGQRDRDAGISFITSSIIPHEARTQPTIANPSNSSISRGTFDYRSSSAISNSTSSSSGGSFISGLKDLSTTNEKHLRFLEASTQNMHKTDIAMAMSLANTNLGENRKVF